jgi:transposase
MQIPGVDWVIAATIIAEVGVDPRIKCPGAGMWVFASASHLASWTGICPGNHESAGKQRGGKTRKGIVYLKTALITAAVTGCRKRGSYLADKHRRLRARRGTMRAAVAIAHKILLVAYHMLASGSDYRELGPTFLDRLDHRRNASQLARRLRDMGYDVQIKLRAA